MKEESSDSSPPVSNNRRFTGKKTPPRGYDADAMQRRVDWLAGQTGHQLDEFALEDPASYKGLVEHQVGYIGLPLSLAGPLRS